MAHLPRNGPNLVPHWMDSAAKTPIRSDLDSLTSMLDGGVKAWLVCRRKFLAASEVSEAAAAAMASGLGAMNGDRALCSGANALIPRLFPAGPRSPSENEKSVNWQINFYDFQLITRDKNFDLGRIKEELVSLSCLLSSSYYTALAAVR